MSGGIGEFWFFNCFLSYMNYYFMQLMSVLLYFTLGTCWVLANWHGGVVLELGALCNMVLL